MPSSFRSRAPRVASIVLMSLSLLASVAMGLFILGNWAQFSAYGNSSNEWAVGLFIALPVIALIIGGKASDTVRIALWVAAIALQAVILAT